MLTKTLTKPAQERDQGSLQGVFGDTPASPVWNMYLSGTEIGDIPLTGIGGSSVVAMDSMGRVTISSEVDAPRPFSSTPPSPITVALGVARTEISAGTVGAIVRAALDPSAEPSNRLTGSDFNAFTLAGGISIPLAPNRWLAQEPIGIARATVRDPSGPVEGEDLAVRFGELRDSWKRKHQFTSSAAAMSMAVEYQQIIGLGRAVIPILLSELRDDPDYWFWALSALTGENPVAQGDRGDFEAMRASWLAWGRRKNMLERVRDA